MGEGQTPQEALVREIVAALTAKLVDRYRVEAEDTRLLVAKRLATASQSVDFTKYNSLKQISRTSWFKNFAASLAKDIYYSLRQYKSAPQALEDISERLNEMTSEQFQKQRKNLFEVLSTAHISTHERSEEMDLFYSTLFNTLKSNECRCRTVADLGCGIQPLFFPFAEAPFPIERYIAADRDRSVVRLLTAAQPLIGSPALRPLCWNLKEGFNGLVAANHGEIFDLVFLLKFITVVQRTELSALQLLRDLPARILVISGAKFALAKRHSIEFKERRRITQCIKEFNREIVAEFTLENEFFYLAR